MIAKVAHSAIVNAADYQLIFVIPKCLAAKP